MNNLSISNFFNRYIFEPNSKDLDKSSKNKAWATTIALGILTVGLVHLSTVLINLVRFKGRITQQVDNLPSRAKTAEIGIKRLTQNQEKLDENIKVPPQQQPPIIDIKNTTSTKQPDHSEASAKAEPLNAPKNPETAQFKSVEISGYNIHRKEYTDAEINNFASATPISTRQSYSNDEQLQEDWEYFAEGEVGRKELEAMSQAELEASEHNGAGERIFIPHYNPREMDVQSVQELIQDCIRRGDRNGLRLLAQTLFSSVRPGRLPNELPMLTCLREMFFHPAFDEMLIGKMMMLAFNEIRDKYEIPFVFVQGYARTSKEWSEAERDEVVKISHGGGMQNIYGFYNEENRGYKLEAGYSSGLQVHIHDNYRSREKDYADRNAWQYFDLPARFSAEIQKRHLLPAVNRNYEAAITPDHINELQNVQVDLYNDPKQIEHEYIKDLLSNLPMAFFSLSQQAEQALNDFEQNNSDEFQNKRGLILIRGIPVETFTQDPSQGFIQKLDKLKESSYIKDVPSIKVHDEEDLPEE